jgi:anti-sigma regulatory factor (Ser/Thr protein kinase)
VGQWRAVIDLPATVHAPASARAVVGSVLRAWELAEISADAQLVISELVTNAYRHAPGTDSFELELAKLSDDGVRISLADGSSIRPIVRELASDAPSGRGMHIVEMLVSEWGAEDHHGGKRIWVRIDRPGSLL